MNEWVKLGIKPLVCILIFVLVMMLYIKPQGVKYEAKEKELNMLQGKGDRIIPLDDIVKEETVADSLFNTVKLMKERLYPLNDFKNLGKELENECRNFNLKLVSLTPEFAKLNLIEQEENEITELPVALSIRGSFLQFAKYLEQVSDLSYLKIIEVNLVRNPDGNPASGEILIELNGIVYFENQIEKTVESKKHLT